MQLVITPAGEVRCIFTELFPLKSLGKLKTERASHVEPFDGGDRWTADMSPVNGPVLGPFDTRTEALAAEVRYLEEHCL